MPRLKVGARVVITSYHDRPDFKTGDTGTVVKNDFDKYAYKVVLDNGNIAYFDGGELDSTDTPPPTREQWQEIIENRNRAIGSLFKK